MTTLKNTLCLLTVSAVFALTTLGAAPAQAQQPGQFQRIYKVQVEYLFFDTDYTYWSTKLETTNRAEAEFLYGILLDAHEDGQLHQVAPHSYWRYIPIDVRMIVEYEYPIYQPVGEYQALSPSPILQYINNR